MANEIEVLKQNQKPHENMVTSSFDDNAEVIKEPQRQVP